MHTSFAFTIIATLVGLASAEVRRSFKLQVSYTPGSYSDKYGEKYITETAYSPTDAYFNVSNNLAGATIFTIDTKGRVVVTNNPASQVNYPVVTAANNAQDIFQPEPKVTASHIQLNCTIPIFPGTFNCTFPQPRQFALIGGQGVTYNGGNELGTLPPDFNFTAYHHALGAIPINLTAIHV